MMFWLEVDHVILGFLGGRRFFAKNIYDQVLGTKTQTDVGPSLPNDGNLQAVPRLSKNPCCQLLAGKLFILET